MKEKIKGLLAGVFFIGFGVFCWTMADEYVLMLFGAIKVDFRIFAAFCGLAGLISIVTALLPRKGKKAAPAARREAAVEEVQERPVPQDMFEEPQPDVRGIVTAAKEEGTPEAFRAAIAELEPYQEADEDNTEVVAGMLACYDGLLRTKGDRSFADYQQRFYAALRAVYLEEHSGRKPTSRRFWAIHSAVHGGIAAASAKDLEQLEDALFMLERAGGMRSELDRDVDHKYMEVAVPSVRCWVAYWIARITATDKLDLERSAEALQLAATLFPREGDLRVCDMNPHMENDKVMLTWGNLESLRAYLMKKAGLE